MSSEVYSKVTLSRRLLCSKVTISMCSKVTLSRRLMCSKVTILYPHTLQPLSRFIAIFSLHVQVEHNLRKISKSSYWQYEQARLNFWQQCNASFEGDHVDPESAAEFFEVGMV